MLKSVVLPGAILGYVFGCLALVIYLSLTPLHSNVATPVSQLPDFAAIKNTREKKTAFFNYLRPSIETQNQKWKKLRLKLLKLQAELAQGEDLSSRQLAFIENQSERYKVQTPSDATAATQLNELLLRVDEIPSSMVLAQAAMESAWGTSRFARQANNLFGQWCFTTGCGLVPKHRSKGAHHEVAKFPNVEAAIAAYFFNINTHNAYALVRDIRAGNHRSQQTLRGHDMVAGLEKYSARGLAYIDELRSMIRSNRLE